MAALSAATLGWMALGTSVVGTGLSIYGQQQQKKAAQSAADWNAQQADANAIEAASVAEYNARLMENQALQTDMDARENIRRQRVEAKRYQATQRARFAKAGVTEEGSPLEVMAETAALLEMDAQEVNRQARVRTAELAAGAAEERRRGAFQAKQYRSQAGFERAYGAAAGRAANIQSAATLLSGVSSYAGTRLEFKKAGVL
jgi:hypothetical protein